jgi:HlyD family secretion protein
MPEDSPELHALQSQQSGIIPDNPHRRPIVPATRGRVRRAGGRRQGLLAIFVIIVIAGLITGGYFLFIPRDDVYTLADYQSTMVEITTLQDTVEISGSVNARRWATVGAPEAGVIDQLYVEEGDWVTSGQTIARLDAESVQDTLLSRQRDLERQTREYNRFVLEHEYTMRSYERKRQDALDAIEDAQDEAAEVSELHDLGGATLAEVEEADDRVQEAEDALEDHDIEVEEYLAIHQLNVENYEDDFAELREEITELEERIADTIITSPISGRVITISDAATTDGELLSQYQTIMELADTRDPLVETEIEEQYVPSIEVGQPVAVEISGTRIPAEVERIGLTATTTASGGTPTVELDIALDVEEAEIVPGSSALVEVLIGEIPDAMVLPRGPYLTSGMRRYLYRVDGEIATRIEVEFGTITDDYVQIVSGVEPGNRIITSSYQYFIDYSTIQIGDNR